jgi:cytidylate kinase
MGMQVEKITLNEFEAAMVEGKKRAPYGQNRVLLKKAEAEPCKLVFENEKKAVSKQTALSVVRRKMNAQVRMFRRGNAVFLGPGDYVPSNRGPRAK